MQQVGDTLLGQNDMGESTLLSTYNRTELCPLTTSSGGAQFLADEGT